MSVGAAAPPAPVARRGSPAQALRALAARVTAAPLPLRAFVVSRLLVLATGSLAVLTSVLRAPAQAAADRHALGPVGSVLAGAVDRFDSAWYLKIATHGYGPASSPRPAFYPLYPFLIRAANAVLGSPVLAGALISSACFLAALVLLQRLTVLELGATHPRAAEATVLLLAFAPLSFFFSAVYTEGPFLLLTVGALLCERRGRWRTACLLAALATLTRPTGIVLVAALGVARLRRRVLFTPASAWLLLAPAALLAYFVVLRAAGYPWLAPVLAEAHWLRSTTSPLIGLYAAVYFAVKGALSVAGGTPIYHPTVEGPLSIPATSVVLLAELTAAVAVLVWARRRLAPEYLVYAAGVILMALASPEPGQPLWSIDRFLTATFPVWMAAGALLSTRPRLLRVVLALSTLALVFYTLHFAAGEFVA